MESNPLKNGALTENSEGIGTVTRKMVHARAVELAGIDGRTKHEVSKADWDQAKVQLTGGLNSETNQELLEAAPESERWDPIPGSNGSKAVTASSEDEDEEGRSDNERLVDEGMAGAELDQVAQCSKQAKIDGE
jgi:hypothetical protein